MANHDERTVARIDLASGKVVADIPVPSEPHRLAYGADAVWVGNWHDDSVSRIDPATNRVVGPPIPIGAHHAGNLVVGAGGVWVTSDYRVDGAAEDTVVVRIDAQTNRAVETIAVGGHPIDVAAAGGRSGCRWPIPAGCCGSPGASVRGVGPVVRNPARPAVRCPFSTPTGDRDLRGCWAGLLPVA